MLAINYKGEARVHATTVIQSILETYIYIYAYLGLYLYILIYSISYVYLYIVNIFIFFHMYFFSYSFFQVFLIFFFFTIFIAGQNPGWQQYFVNCRCLMVFLGRLQRSPLQ